MIGKKAKKNNCIHCKTRDYEKETIKELVHTFCRNAFLYYWTNIIS